jgi:DNA-binding response OmpR family regulator
MAEKILVIDDEETTVQLISMLLERRGYDVIKAYRAEDGLRKGWAEILAHLLGGAVGVVAL